MLELPASESAVQWHMKSVVILGDLQSSARSKKASKVGSSPIRDMALLPYITPGPWMKQWQGHQLPG